MYWRFWSNIILSPCISFDYSMDLDLFNFTHPKNLGRDVKIPKFQENPHLLPESQRIPLKTDILFGLSKWLPSKQANSIFNNYYIVK